MPQLQNGIEEISSTVEDPYIILVDRTRWSVVAHAVGIGREIYRWILVGATTI